MGMMTMSYLRRIGHQTSMMKLHHMIWRLIIVHGQHKGMHGPPRCSRIGVLVVSKGSYVITMNFCLC
jgi:hypothetical protein